MLLQFHFLYFCIFLWDGVLCAAIPRLNPLWFPADLEAEMIARSTCTASTGYLPMDFSWLKDSLPFNNDMLPYEIKQLDSYTSALTLGPLHENHTGNYTCVASNSVGSDSTIVSLLIKVAPRWVELPFNVSVEEHDSITVPCLAAGSPKPQVDWTRNVPGNQPVEKRWNVGVNGSLNIPRAQKSDAGFYTCRAHNGVGAGLTRIIKITVWVRPRVAQKYLSESVEKGKDSILTCEASGDQPLTISWTKDRRVLSEDGSSRYRFTHTHQEDGSVTLLHIYNADPRDSGVYMCTVRNEAGQDSMSVRLSVTEKPSVPLDVEVSDLWSRNVRIRWSTQSAGSTSVLQYTMEYWEAYGHEAH